MPFNDGNTTNSTTNITTTTTVSTNKNGRKIRSLDIIKQTLLKDKFVISEKINRIEEEENEDECYFIFWGSYPPSKCGVGEYNKNMLMSISQQSKFNCKIS